MFIREGPVCPGEESRRYCGAQPERTCGPLATKQAVTKRSPAALRPPGPQQGGAVWLGGYFKAKPRPLEGTLGPGGHKLPAALVRTGRRHTASSLAFVTLLRLLAAALSAAYPARPGGESSCPPGPGRHDSVSSVASIALLFTLPASFSRAYPSPSGGEASLFSSLEDGEGSARARTG